MGLLYTYNMKNKLIRVCFMLLRLIYDLHSFDLADLSITAHFYVVHLFHESFYTT